MPSVTDVDKYRSLPENRRRQAARLVIRGYKFHEQDDYASSIDLYKRATVVDPNYFKAYLMLGTALNNIGSNVEAVEAFRRSIELKPENAVTYDYLGVALRELERYEESIASFRKAIELDSECIEPYENLTYALWRLGRYKEARQAYEPVYYMLGNDKVVADTYQQF